MLAPIRHVVPEKKVVQAHVQRVGDIAQAAIIPSLKTVVERHRVVGLDFGAGEVQQSLDLLLLHVDLVLVVVAPLGLELLPQLGVRDARPPQCLAESRPHVLDGIDRGVVLRLFRSPLVLGRLPLPGPFFLGLFVKEGAPIPAAEVIAAIGAAVTVPARLVAVRSVERLLQNAVLMVATGSGLHRALPRVQRLGQVRALLDIIRHHISDVPVLTAGLERVADPALHLHRALGQLIGHGLIHGSFAVFLQQLRSQLLPDHL